MKKVALMLSLVMVMVSMTAMPAYAMGMRGGYYAQPTYTTPNTFNVNYNTTSGSAISVYPTIDVESLVSAQETYFNSLVAQGVITREQADLSIANYRSMLEYRTANGGGYGYGMMGGYGGFCGGGYGMMGGYGMYGGYSQR